MNSRIPLSRGTALALSFVAGTAAAQSQVHKSAHHDYRVVTVAEGLVHPWSIAFLPGGDMLVTERPGRLRLVRNGQLLADPVPGTPEVLAQGQGGLLEVTPHPDYAANRLLYITYSKAVPGQRGGTTALARARFENDRLTGLVDLFVADTRPTAGHYGSRLAFDRNGHVFMTVGDRQIPPAGDLPAHPAQDLSNHHGKVLRLDLDGRAPADNPFVGREGAKPEIWSYGHRNQQGLIIHPETGDLWATEHGPQGGDELNLIQAGKNYGWPVVGFGVNYRTGAAIHSGTHREGMEPPVHVWIPSIATSGLLLYTGDKFPDWKGNLFVGGLNGQQLARLTLDGRRVKNEETLVQDMGRIRDVRQGLDGFIYLAIDDRQGGLTRVVRLEPVPRH